MSNNNSPSFRNPIWFSALWLMCLSSLGQTVNATRSVPFTDPRLKVIGQVDLKDVSHPRLAYPATGLVFRFTGKSVELHLSSTADTSALTVVVDDGLPLTYALSAGSQTIAIAAGTASGAQKVEIYKRTETWQGVLTLESLALPEGSELLAAPELPRRRLLFIGDSVTCGAGMDDNATCVNDRQHPANNAYETYGMLLGRSLDAESRLVCYGGRGLERDYRGLESKDDVLTVPQLITLSVPSDQAEERASWDPASWQPDAIIVSVGTNDFSLQATKPLDPKRWVGEYVTFVKHLRQFYPKSLIFLTEGSIVTDPLLRQYVQQVAEATRDLQVRYMASEHYPGTSCNQHPTEEQHRRIANDFKSVLQSALGW